MFDISELKCGDRITALVTGVIYLTMDDYVVVHSGHHELRIDLASIEQRIPAIMDRDDIAWSDRWDAEVCIVLHDDKAGQYVVRHRSGHLSVEPDDGNIRPIAEQRALVAPDPAHQEQRAFLREEMAADLGLAEYPDPAAAPLVDHLPDVQEKALDRSGATEFAEAVEKQYDDAVEVDKFGNPIVPPSETF